MKPRRSRISRIYRHLTRREPNRKARWQEISGLRPHGSVGSSSVGISRHAHVPDVRTMLWTETEPSYSDKMNEAFAEPQGPTQTSERDHTGTLVAALAISLFLLGCAYAAVAGYMLSVRPVGAYVAIGASIVSLIAAMVGIGMAASRTQRRYCGRFLACSMISLAAIYGVLLAAVL